ncbi:uncharacterized protein BYT42DRAFT_610073 [Radiomyces spectabilis]|uniref:uncharacterized protein n=1 Tax=Radiomyces spectabilis TaxID=64574 RepID=UPI002220E963|nr:uncharacterized protein BYT42DRAFT_610073 [Radiomyces spectabilis]KAI8394353.1 hypothetical protein BYT42DRAFT_610073 [Radiomyces spectabilis]
MAQKINFATQMCESSPQPTHTVYPTSHYSSQQFTPTYYASCSDLTEQEQEVFTPLISPAMTPSFGFQGQSKFSPCELDFSPLTSPAIMPHFDRRYHERSMSSLSGHSFSGSLTPGQICQQYEQLEQVKRMITRKLSELHQDDHHEQTSPRPSSNNTVLQSQMSPSAESSDTKRLPTRTGYGENPPLSASVKRAHGPASSFSANPAPLSPGQSPCLAPVTPASLMKMRVVNPCNNNKKLPLTKMSAQVTPPLDSQPDWDSPVSVSKALPEKRAHARKKENRSTHTKSHPAKRTRRESSAAQTYASSRALKPLLISPTLGPGVNANQEAERILATRSNYQNLMEGKAAALGIAFSPQIRSGIETRRTAHKAAEQKRRDSLKLWFERLRCEVEEGYVKKKASLTSKVIREQEREANHKSLHDDDDEDTSLADNSSTSPVSMHETDEISHDNQHYASSSSPAAKELKPLSKVLLLRYAYEYITMLKTTLNERDERIEALSKENHQLKDQCHCD